MKLIITTAAMLMAGSAIEPPPGPAPAVAQEAVPPT